MSSAITGIIGKTIFYDVLSESISNMINYLDNSFHQHNTLQSILKELDIQYTLKLIRTFLQGQKNKLSNETMKFCVSNITKTCKEIKHLIDKMKFKSDLHNQSYYSYILVVNLSNEKKQLQLLKNQLLNRFDLLLKIKNTQNNGNIIF